MGRDDFFFAGTAAFPLSSLSKSLSSQGKGLFGGVHAVELRDLIGEHGEDPSRVATELQDAVGANAYCAVEILVAVSTVVQGCVEVGR